MNNSKLQTVLLTALSILLFAGGTAYFAKGLRLSRGHDNDGDMKTKWNQYSLFEQGMYPHCGGCRGKKPYGGRTFSVKCRGISGIKV